MCTRVCARDKECDAALKVRVWAVLCMSMFGQTISFRPQVDRVFFLGLPTKHFVTKASEKGLVVLLQKKKFDTKENISMTHWANTNNRKKKERECASSEGRVMVARVLWAWRSGIN